MSSDSTTSRTGVDRLPFVLPDFTRISWVSDEARDLWGPRLQAITTAWTEIEWLSVRDKVRSCAITVLSPEAFVASGPTWAGHGLNAMPLEIQGVGQYSYSSTAVAAQPGQPIAFRMVIGTPENVSAFKTAYDAGDEHRIGDLLGYPACCREFYRRVWVEDGCIDTTWPMALATAEAVDNRVSIEESPPQANILWRWMGVRTVSHLPCRLDCPATVEVAERLIGAGRENGYAQEMDWLLEILSWPVEWSTLHGIAEIKTPILKVSTRSDATAHKYSLQREGTSYPDAGMPGLKFPYRISHQPKVTLSAHFKRGLDNPISATEAPPAAWYASDNGFSTVAAMERAHKPIVDLATKELSGVEGSIIDLGCGNGALLAKVCKAVPGLMPVGVDTDEGRLGHFAELNPGPSGRAIQCDIFDVPAQCAGDRFALALLMAGRLLEVDASRTADLRRWLASNCDRILVYAYGDWLTRYGNLGGLIEQAGGFRLETDPRVPAGMVVCTEPSAG
jgi:hypothetical protein